MPLSATLVGAADDGDGGGIVEEVQGGMMRRGREGMICRTRIKVGRDLREVFALLFEVFAFSCLQLIGALRFEVVCCW